MIKLLEILAGQLIFFLDPHGYSICASQGSASGSAYIDLKRRGLIWRLMRDRDQVTLELRLREDRDYPSYSIDILKRWLTGKRDDQACLLTPEVGNWIQAHLTEIEQALEGPNHQGIRAELGALKNLRAKELFG